jgi:hypothetical protein
MNVLLCIGGQRAMSAPPKWQQDDEGPCHVGRLAGDISILRGPMERGHTDIVANGGQVLDIPIPLRLRALVLLIAASDSARLSNATCSSPSLPHNGAS